MVEEAGESISFDKANMSTKSASHPGEVSRGGATLTESGMLGWPCCSYWGGRVKLGAWRGWGTRGKRSGPK